MKKPLFFLFTTFVFQNAFTQMVPKMTDSVVLTKDSMKAHLTAAPTNAASGQVQLGLSIAVLSFGLILTVSLLYFLSKSGKAFGNVAFKTVGIVLILTGSLFLVVAGYSQDQITPVIGLLGTVAGFVFGSNLKSSTTKEGEE